MTLGDVCNFCLIVLAMGLGLTLFRIVKGPTVPDRIAALDLTAALMVSTVGVLCIKTKDSSYLDVAVVLAIVAFLSTTAFSRYLERRANQNDQ